MKTPRSTSSQRTARTTSNRVRRTTRIAGRASSVTFTLAAVLFAGARPASAAVPDPKPGMPKELEDKTDTLLGLLMALVIVACVAGVLLVAGKMALAFRRGEGGEAAGQLGVVMGACLLVGSASSIVLFLV